MITTTIITPHIHMPNTPTAPKAPAKRNPDLSMF